MANVGNTSVSTRFAEHGREITQLKDEIQNLWSQKVQLHQPIGRPDFGAIEEVNKKLNDKKMKLEELFEKMQEVMKEMATETPQ